MKIKNIEYLKKIVLDKDANVIMPTMNVSIIINPGVPDRAGEDILDKLNKMYNKFYRK